MSKKAAGTGIMRLLFGLGKKEMRVIPYNQMTSEQFEQLDRFLGKVGFAVAGDALTLTKKQSDYVINQIRQLDLYRKNMMPGKKPDFKDFIPRENLGIPKADKAKEFKGFTPKVIQGDKMSGIEAMKEASSIIGRKGKYKNMPQADREKRLKELDEIIREANSKPDDFAGGGLATAIAKIKGKYGKKAIMKGKTKKKSEKQKLREMFEEFNKRSKEREEFIFGGGVGYKGVLKMLAKREGMDKPSDVLKKGNPKSQVPKRIKPLLSDREKSEMKNLRIEQLENQLGVLKTSRALLKNRDNFPSQLREVGDDMIRMMLPDEVRQSLKGSTVESLDKEILQIENVLKNLKVGKDKRALNADGGLATMFRPRLKDGGPPNPGRRNFMKLMAGLASLPIVGKLFKGAKIAKVVPLKNTTTTMPAWFPNFVDRMVTKNVGSKIDADVMLYKDKDLPGVELYKYDDGRIEVQGKNAYDSEYDINYTPPGYEVMDYETGRTVKVAGDFEASDTVYRQTGPELDDVDVDGAIVDDVDDILGGNSTQLEGYAKGTGETKYTKGQRRIDQAESRLDMAEQPDPDIDAIEEANEGYAKGGLVTMFRKK